MKLINVATVFCVFLVFILIGVFIGFELCSHKSRAVPAAAPVALMRAA